MTDSAWVEFGALTRPHGLRGELRLVPFGDDASFPEERVDVRLRSKRGDVTQIRLRSARAVPGALLVAFEGFETRTAAEGLAGSHLDVPAQSLPELEPGEFYVHELVGAQALDEAARPLGEIIAVADNNGQDLLTVLTAKGERLLPLVPETLRRFDRKERIAILWVPEGLWDGLSD